MTNEQALLAALLAVVCITTVPASIRLMVAITDSEPLWEPQWKREARLLARYIPEADEWGR